MPVNLLFQRNCLTFPNISEATGFVELSANLNTPWGSILTNDLSGMSRAPPGTVVEGAAEKWMANNSGVLSLAESWVEKIAYTIKNLYGVFQ